MTFGEYLHFMALISLFTSLHELISEHVKLTECPREQFPVEKLQVAAHVD
jgi:hypothetical protein